MGYIIIVCLFVGPTAVLNMWEYISAKLLEAIPLEPDPDISEIMMDSLCKVSLERSNRRRRRKGGGGVIKGGGEGYLF